MPKFVIEREIGGIGNMPPVEMRGAAQKSNDVLRELRELGQQIQWLHSYVAGDKTYCVYIASSEDVIREHAQRSGFPANKITEIKTIIDPTTAET